MTAASGGSKQLPIRRAGVGDEEVGGLARVDLQRGRRGSVFSVFIGRKEWLLEPVMESRHVSVVHTPAEPAAFPVTRPTLRVSPSRSNPANFSPTLSLSPFSASLPFCSALTNGPSPARICTCKLTDRHWIPLVHEHTLAQVTRRVNALVEVSYRISSARRARS